MPPRIPDDKREAILEDLQSGQELSARRIGARHGVSDFTVRKIAAENGITDAFSREHTENATRARLADLKERRSLLAAGLLDDAEALRERAWTEYVHTAPVGQKLETITVALPPLAEVRNAYAAIGIATDKHLALIKHDGGIGLDEAKSMLGAVAEGLQAAYEQLKADDPE